MWSDYATLEEVFTLKHNKKTNAARILDDMNITYRIMEYEVDENNLTQFTLLILLVCQQSKCLKLWLSVDKTGVLLQSSPVMVNWT